MAYHRVPTREKFHRSRGFLVEVPWNPRSGSLRGTLEEPIALDTETEPIQHEYHVPRLALVAVATSRHRALIHPNDFAVWWRNHARMHVVCHNATFDFWVIHRALESDPQAQQLWVRCVDEGRMHDTMLLDQLVRMARGDASISRRDLATVYEEYGQGDLDVSKADPHRMRYAELINSDWSRVRDTGFWEYAIRDAEATRQVWLGLIAQARKIAARTKLYVSPNAWSRWGPLTESLQVRGAIALFDAGRRGLLVDTDAAQALKQSLENRIDFNTMVLQGWDPGLVLYEDECNAVGAPQRWKFSAPVFPGWPRQIVRTPGTGVPRLKYELLRDRLKKIWNEHECGPPPDSLAAEFWEPLRERHAGVRAWLDFTHLAKILGYVRPLLNQTRIFPVYNPLVRTGRASAFNPNVQQFPRDPEFRSIFHASPGFLMASVDYSYIELRTLASICEKWFGKSELARVIRAGRDPHTFTASILKNLKYEDFQEVLQSPHHPRWREFREYRQSAKALNFGVPGGLGAKRLADYAVQAYGVTMTELEAESLRHQLIHEVYPELETYLKDRWLTRWSFRFGLDFGKLKELFRKSVPPQECDRVEVILKYPRVMERGVPLGLWRFLEHFSEFMPKAVVQEVSNGRASGKLPAEVVRWISQHTALVPTGRVRGGCTFPQSRNTPFQGLAADGAKLAMWKLVSQGFRVVGFVHDELLVEVPEESAEADLARIQEVMKRSMEEVLKGVPAEVQGTLSKCWSK